MAGFDPKARTLAVGTGAHRKLIEISFFAIKLILIYTLVRFALLANIESANTFAAWTVSTGRVETKKFGITKIRKTKATLPTG